MQDGGFCIYLYVCYKCLFDYSLFQTTISSNTIRSLRTSEKKFTFLEICIFPKKFITFFYRKSFYHKDDAEISEYVVSHY